MQTLAATRARLIASVHNNNHKYVESAFLYHGAPVLRGVKPAALMPLSACCLCAWRERKFILRRASGLCTVEISTARGKFLLLIYDKHALQSIMGREPNALFLAEYGYPAHCELAETLEYLKGRFLGQGFPHEVGMFLGYPVEDVRGFIHNAGRDYICCRYWKVYSNAERAMEIFGKIDEAYSAAIDLIIQSLPVHIAAKLLRWA
ncbi:MAG: DUF3793 family protein [Clostridiales bacterium]|nr:DUF3793 family protein [Clostridiales bacterium]